MLGVLGECFGQVFLFFFSFCFFCGVGEFGWMSGEGGLKIGGLGGIGLGGIGLGVDRRGDWAKISV